MLAHANAALPLWFIGVAGGEARIIVKIAITIVGDQAAEFVEFAGWSNFFSAVLCKYA